LGKAERGGGQKGKRAGGVERAGQANSYINGISFCELAIFVLNSRKFFEGF
jgi:hypothetical protein